jgi:hypothetical protein
MVGAHESGERESSPFRAALPASNSAPKEDRELEEKIFTLVTAVAQTDGMTYPPEWAAVAHVAKARGYLNELGLALHLAELGKQWLAQRAAAPSSGYTMTKIDPRARLALKELGRDTGVTMQEALGEIVEAVHANRDALTRIARAHGLTNPWEAIGKLARGK